MVAAEGFSIYMYIYIYIQHVHAFINVRPILLRKKKRYTGRSEANHVESNECMKDRP